MHARSAIKTQWLAPPFVSLNHVLCLTKQAGKGPRVTLMTVPQCIQLGPAVSYCQKAIVTKTEAIENQQYRTLSREVQPYSI